MSKGWQLYMQSQSRRRFIILGAVGFVVLLVLFFVLRGGGGVTGGSYKSTCEDFIDTIIAQDEQKSYAMFTDQTQRNLTRPAWKEKLRGMQPSHYQATYTLTSTNDLTPEKTNTDDEDPVPSFQFNYDLSSPPIYAAISCIAAKTDDGIKIDGYSLSPRSKEADSK